MKKQERERAVFRMIYDESRFVDVRHGDRPDFTLRYASRAQRFGVEITDLYRSESDARLHLAPGYFHELLSGKAHRHKDDVGVLEVSEAQIEDLDGRVQGEPIKMIMRAIPPTSESVRRLAKRIADKGRQFTGYESGLSHVNLIVSDHTLAFANQSVDEFYRHALAEELTEALWRTPFREVYLVTTVSKSREVFFPLKLLVLLADWYTFTAALFEFRADWHEYTGRSHLDLYVEFAQRRGRDVMLLGGDDDVTEVAFGDAGIVWEDDHIGIRLHADYENTRPVLAASCGSQDETIGDEFERFLADYRTQRVFTSELAFDVRSSVEVNSRKDASTTLLLTPVDGRASDR